MLLFIKGVTSATRKSDRKVRLTQRVQLNSQYNSEKWILTWGILWPDQMEYNGLFGCIHSRSALMFSFIDGMFSFMDGTFSFMYGILVLLRGSQFVACNQWHYFDIFLRHIFESDLNKHASFLFFCILNNSRWIITSSVMFPLVCCLCYVYSCCWLLGLPLSKCEHGIFDICVEGHFPDQRR